MSTHDVVVLGGGPGGYATALSEAIGETMLALPGRSLHG